MESTPFDLTNQNLRSRFGAGNLTLAMPVNLNNDVLNFDWSNQKDPIRKLAKLCRVAKQCASL